MGQRRMFSPEFRSEAAKLVIETGCPIAHVGEELGVSSGLLGKWGKPKSNAMGTQMGKVRRICVQKAPGYTVS